MKWQAVFSILLLAIAILLVLLFIEIRQKVPIVQTLNRTIFSDDEKALVTYVNKRWGENEYNSSEIIVNVALYNYGYEEAKNVVMTCGIYDADSEGNYKSDIPITKITSNLGNVASTSYKDTQLYITNDKLIDDYSLSSCFIASCENCEILDNRLT